MTWSRGLWSDVLAYNSLTGVYGPGGPAAVHGYAGINIFFGDGHVGWLTRPYSNGVPSYENSGTWSPKNWWAKLEGGDWGAP